MNIENIEAFVHVIHFNSFNKAAEALFLSQPSVSARIQSLERELDVKLFDRLGKQFTLTEKGKQFLPYAQQILQSYKKGKQQLKYQQTWHELRIGCSVSAASYLLPALLSKLRHTHPHLRIKLVTASSETITKLLQEKEVDVGFVRNISHPLLDSLLFYEDKISLYVYKDHPFARRSEVAMEEIGGESLIFFECGSLDWMRLHRIFETLDHRPHIQYELDNLETAKKLIISGMGIGFLPELCAAREAEEGHIIPVAVPSLGLQSLRTHLLTLKGEQSELSRTLLHLSKHLPQSYRTL